MVTELPLAPDGSLHAMIPSGASFMFQSLNGDGVALRSPGRWFYAHPGEQFSMSVPYSLFPQTCGGCHGALTGEPNDTFGRPDAVTSASRTATTWDASGHHERQPANWGQTLTLKRVTFDADIRPILDEACVGCHTQEDSLDLASGSAFEALRRFVAHREALSGKSYLVEKLTGKELRAPRALSGDGPHPAEGTLGGDDLLTIVRWIDLGSQRGGPAKR